MIQGVQGKRALGETEWATDFGRPLWVQVYNHFGMEGRG
jgi:hypothetical protein